MTALPPRRPTHLTLYVGAQGERIDLPLRKSFITNSRRIRRCELHEGVMTFETLWQIMTGNLWSLNMNARADVLALLSVD